MDQSSKSKRGEARQFWLEAIRLWTDSGLSVREFCRREGLTEYSFYSWRRALQPKTPTPEISQESSGPSDAEAVAKGRRRRRREQVVSDEKPEAAASFFELVPPPSTGLCHCTLELENPGGAKMRIELRSPATPDLAAISQSFWSHG